MDVIAERRFLAKFVRGTTSPVIIRVGRPFPHPEGCYACKVEAEGLRDRPVNIYGIDSWQALMLGLGYVRSMMAMEVERGVIFYWEDDPDPVKLEELFNVH